MCSRCVAGARLTGAFGSRFGGAGRDPGPRKARAIHHTHKVSLEDIYRGKVSKLALQKSVICSKCDGRGGKDGAVKKCSSCGGLGVKTMMRQMGPMIQRFQTACQDCEGEGEITRDKDRCKQCHGKKTIVERVILHVHVDKGVRSGQKIDFRGEGDQMPGMEPGDVQFEIEQKPHARFQRKDDDLFYLAKIDLVTALAGGTIYIEHLDERWLSIDIKPGDVISPGRHAAAPLDLSPLIHAAGDVRIITGQGMPSYRHHDHGNLYVRFEVQFPPPNFNTEAAIEGLRAILPPPEDRVMPDKDAIEPVDLDVIDASQEARAQGASMMDEDEEDGHPGGERMQCASQ